jgi:hypothetical protein
MGYATTKSGKVKRTYFPKKLSAQQKKQIDEAKTNTELIEKVIESTKNIVFTRYIATA